MIVRSIDGLEAPAQHGSESLSIETGLYAGSRWQTYARIYKRQPYVRTAVDFIARNVASVPIHVFRRRGDDDRERLTDHGLARFLASPNRSQSQFAFFLELLADCGIYGRALRMKVRPKTGPELEAVRIPPECVEVHGAWFPESYTVQLQDGPIELSASDVFDISLFDPENVLGSTAPIETLRLVLEEDAARTAARSAHWKRGARPGAVIEQTGRGLQPEQKAAFMADWARLYSGPERAGGTPLLEPGMSYKQTGPNSASDEQVAESRKLTREEVAMAYHLPPPFLGMLDDASFANISNLRGVLYQDVLGPWFVWISQEIERQLLPEFVDVADVYCDYATAAKLAGNFEENAKVLETLAGRPVLTANEARARLNYAAMDQADADQLWLQPGTPGARGPAGDGEPAPPAGE